MVPISNGQPVAPVSHPNWPGWAGFRRSREGPDAGASVAVDGAPWCKDVFFLRISIGILGVFYFFFMAKNNSKKSRECEEAMEISNHLQRFLLIWFKTDIDSWSKNYGHLMGFALWESPSSRICFFFVISESRYTYCIIFPGIALTAFYFIDFSLKIWTALLSFSVLFFLWQRYVMLWLYGKSQFDSETWRELGSPVLGKPGKPLCGLRLPRLRSPWDGATMGRVHVKCHDRAMVYSKNGSYPSGLKVAFTSPDLPMSSMHEF